MTENQSFTNVPADATVRILAESDQWDQVKELAATDPFVIFKPLANGIRTRNLEMQLRGIDIISEHYGVTLPVGSREMREFLAENAFIVSREHLADGMIDLLNGIEGFAPERFRAIATFDDSLGEKPVYEYPTTARRAFVNLAEAVRTINETHSMRDMLVAIAGLHMDEDDRQVVLMTYLANIPFRVSFSPVHRENLASSLARLLDGREKFHAGRFIHHATSDSTADDDGTEGKWSYNRLHPEEAQKTTIEGGEDSSPVVL